MKQAWLLFSWLFYYLPAVDFNVEDNVTTANSLLCLKKSLTSGWSYCWFYNPDRESWVPPFIMFSPVFDSHPHLLSQTCCKFFLRKYFLFICVLHLLPHAYKSDFLWHIGSLRPLKHCHHPGQCCCRWISLSHAGFGVTGVSWELGRIPLSRKTGQNKFGRILDDCKMNLSHQLYHSGSPGCQYSQ